MKVKLEFTKEAPTDGSYLILFRLKTPLKGNISCYSILDGDWVEEYNTFVNEEDMPMHARQGEELVGWVRNDILVNP